MLAVYANCLSSAMPVYSSEGLSMICAFAIQAFVRLSQLVNDSKVHMSVWIKMWEQTQEHHCGGQSVSH